MKVCCIGHVQPLGNAGERKHKGEALWVPIVCHHVCVAGHAQDPHHPLVASALDILCINCSILSWFPYVGFIRVYILLHIALFLVFLMNCFIQFHVSNTIYNGKYNCNHLAWFESYKITKLTILGLTTPSHWKSNP